MSRLVIFVASLMLLLKHHSTQPQKEMNRNFDLNDTSLICHDIELTKSNSAKIYQFFPEMGRERITSLDLVAQLKIVFFL